MSEQKGEQTSGEPTSLGVGSDVSCSSDTQSEPVATSAQEPAHGLANAETPRLVPEQVAAREMPEADAPKADAAATHAPNPDAAEADAPRIPGKVIIMSSGDRAWADQDAGSEPDAGESQGMFGKRRIAALAAVVALAVIAGALGGALATMVLTHVTGDDTASSGNHALEVSMARIDAEVLALKASVEHTSKLGLSQFSRTSDRLDKLEKAQAEPAAKIAKLSETVDKLRAAPAAALVPVASAPAAAKDVTGSVSPSAAAPATPPKVEVGRLPTVEGWILRDVSHGGALIEGRQGIYEVYAGDPVPGLGRIDAIRRQDGHWVVVTSRGLIVAR
ncbi:MAG: hypothetical protein ACLQDM_30260 [Bradyrhizobium sp.]